MFARMGPVEGWGLIRRFTFLSLAIIGLMAVVLGWTATSYLTEVMLQREKAVTADLVEHVARMHFPTADSPTARRSLADRFRLKEVTRELQQLSEVVRIKVFDSNGTIIWSDVPDLIGSNFGGDALLQRGLGGEVVVELEPIDDDEEHRAEYGTFQDLMAIYVPLKDGSQGEVVAVVEVYKDPKLLKMEISEKRMTIWAIVIAGSVILFLGQVGLVTRAASTITTQYNQLKQRTAEMEAINTRLKSARTRLVEAERLAAIGEVTAAVAHGIRNPLGNIRSVAQEAAQGLEAEDPLRETLGEIIQQVDLLEGRLRSFLTTTKSFDFSLSPTLVSEIVDHTLEGIQKALEQKGAGIGVDIEEGLWVDCDAGKIEEALQELLVNSVEAGAHHIRVIGREAVNGSDRAGVHLIVEDDGKGLAAGARAKVLEPFFTTKPLGTGLGLVVVTRIIEGHEGKLNLEHVPAGGTRVTVWLPLSSAEEKESLS